VVQIECGHNTSQPKEVEPERKAVEPRPRIVHPEIRKRYYPFGLAVPVNKRMR
jgi:hypothetical protein